MLWKTCCLEWEPESKAEKCAWSSAKLVWQLVHEFQVVHIVSYVQMNVFKQNCNPGNLVFHPHSKSNVSTCQTAFLQHNASRFRDKLVMYVSMLNVHRCVHQGQVSVWNQWSRSGFSLSWLQETLQWVKNTVTASKDFLWLFPSFDAYAFIHWALTRGCVLVCAHGEPRNMWTVGLLMSRCVC